MRKRRAGVADRGSGSHAGERKKVLWVGTCLAVTEVLVTTGGVGIWPPPFWRKVTPGNRSIVGTLSRNPHRCGRIRRYTSWRIAGAQAQVSTVPLKKGETMNKKASSTDPPGARGVRRS